MKSIIKDSMTSALLTANLITKQQHAFISKHSTTSNLLLTDHFVVTATLSSAKLHPACISHEVRNIKAMDMKAFRTKLLASSVYTAPMTSTNDYAEQLRQCVVGVLDQLAPSKKMTKRCGKPSNRWISSEAIAARCSRRQLERRYRRTKMEADRLS